MAELATKATTLFSLAVVKSYVKAAAADHDVALVAIADGVSARIDAYTRRPFVTRSIVETRDGTGTAQLQLRHLPVVSITTAKYRYSLLDAWTTLGATEYELDAFRGYLLLNSLAWPKVVQGVEITYSAGYGAKDSTTLPADIVQAALDFVKFVYDRWKSDTISLGSLSMQAGGSAVIVPELPKDLKATLDPYIKRRL